MLLASLGEVVSIGAVLPFIGALTAPEQVFNNELVQPVINLLELTKPNQLLLPLTFVFIIAALLSGALRLLLLWAQTRLSHAIGLDLSYEIYRRTLYQPYAQHVARNSSEVISGITHKANSVVGHIVLPLLQITSSVLMLFMILATLFSINAVVASSAFIGFGLIYGLIVLTTKPQLLRNSECVSQMADHRIKALQEGLGGIRDVLLDGTQSAYCKIYRNAEMPMRHALASNQFISTSPRFVIEALGMIMIAGLAYSLTVTGDGITNAIPVLGALALGAQRLLPVLQQGYSSWSSIRGGQASLRDALDLLEQPLPIYVNTPQPVPMLFDHAIHVKQLSFRYSLDAPWVLRNLSLKITKGSRIGFIGTTGSGKSTLLDILMGLLFQSEGQFCVDHIPITKDNHRAWQMHIAHVPQSIFLADSSIAENIALGVPPDQIDQKRVHHAARQAQISDTIEGWDEQYDMLVGERGVRLSGGQRQRIGIARALYKQADVIVFDEATSALDNETERSVMEAIDSIGRDITILIVAHRLSTLKSCDQVIELELGRVKRQGVYQEMVKY
jgi:ATP-binding cassette, subfamily B, bacterial PglK